VFYPRKGALHHKNYPGRVDFKMTILAGLKKLKKFKGVERVLLPLPWRENFLPVLPTGHRLNRQYDSDMCSLCVRPRILPVLILISKPMTVFITACVSANRPR
jgi:hypothetical protein